MAKYNKTFELGLKDLALVEQCLRDRLAATETLEEIDDINRLLGHLHNQKIWYRPSKGGPYISG